MLVKVLNLPLSHLVEFGAAMPKEWVRSFIAVDIDNETILNNILEARNSLTETGADLKLVEPENIHITLRFLGEIPVDMIERVYEGMRQVDLKPFEIEFKGLGAFPDLRRLRVIWVGITKGREELESVFNQLEPKLRSMGFQADRKGFSPHVTIARVRSARNKARLADLISTMRDREFGILKANGVKLKKSTLTPKGPIYSTLHEVRCEP